jgi:hypothetical protein
VIGLQWLADELRWLADALAITVVDGTVWLAICQGLLLGGICLFVGTWVARTVGLLASDAPAGETLGVGLSTGLMVLAAWWAAIWSGGRSSFAPVAIGFVIAIAIAIARRLEVPADGDAVAAAGTDNHLNHDARSRPNHRSMVLTMLAGGIFVVAVALLYGLTIAPSPGDGVQPVEDRDVAFYAVLGRDLATTGTETNLSPSGFTDQPGFPAQTWYHWGELWLASAVIQIFGTAPLAARYFVVLPVALLAVAALTGTLVRRLVGGKSRGDYMFGFAACLFLAPLPLIPGPFFSSWAVGMIFGITLYGLGAVAGLMALYSVVVLSGRAATWALGSFVGSAVAFILPAHLAIAVLALVGVGIVWTIRAIQTTNARRLPLVPHIWVRTLIATSVAILATVLWGMATGHSQGGGSSSGVAQPTVVSPFNASWRESVAITVLCAGAFLAIPVAWFLRRREAPLYADLYLGAIGLLAVGAVGWGARLGDFTMFYLYFAGIAVFATPLAAVAVMTVWERLRAMQHHRLAVGLIILCLLQLDVGVASGIVRLQRIGPPGYEPLPLSLLGAIRQLPPNTKLAYSCGPFDEVAFAAPELLSIDAHAGARVVPMCFEAEFPSTLLGAEPSVKVVSQFFRGAPQLALYPDAAADPSPEAVTAFLKRHGIYYIFADLRHPNTLVPHAVLISTSGSAQILRIP